MAKGNAKAKVKAAAEAPDLVSFRMSPAAKTLWAALEHPVRGPKGQVVDAHEVARLLFGDWLKMNAKV